MGVNDLMNSNNSIDKLLKNIYNMAEKRKKNEVKKVFISDIVKNNRINDFTTQEVNWKIYDDCQKEEDCSFIINDGIGSNDLFGDGLHLLDSGKQGLANNFIFNINSFLSFCTNRSGQGTYLQKFGKVLNKSY